MFRNYFMYFKRPSVWRYSTHRPLYFGFLYFFKMDSSLKPHLNNLNFLYIMLLKDNMNSFIKVAY